MTTDARSLEAAARAYADACRRDPQHAALFSGPAGAIAADLLELAFIRGAAWRQQLELDRIERRLTLTHTGGHA